MVSSLFKSVSIKLSDASIICETRDAAKNKCELVIHEHRHVLFKACL